MTWSYSGNPGASDLDAVRFWVGDVWEGTPQLTDEELTYLLSLTGGKVLPAAIAACLELANRYSSQVDFAVESELRVDLSQRAEAYAKRATELREQASIPGTVASRHPMPYAGGLSTSDMARQAADMDRVAPNFWVGMHDERGPTEAETEEP
jgi:hypothetical protein